MCVQSSDADVVARSAEDGGGEQEGPDGDELHKVTQQSGRPTDCVCLGFFFLMIFEIVISNTRPQGCDPVLSVSPDQVQVRVC